MKLILISLFLSLTLAPNVQAKKSLKAHTLGHAKFSLAADSAKREIYVEMEAASKGILGFEWKPHSKKEKADWKKVQSLWNDALIELDSSKKCQLKEKQIKLVFEKEDDHKDDHHKEKHHHGEKHHKKKHHGEHSEIHATMRFKCQNDPANQKVTVKLLQLFNQAKLHHKHHLEEVEFKVIPAVKAPYKLESEKAKVILEL